jgi:putative glutamine amidotransferase
MFNILVAGEEHYCAPIVRNLVIDYRIFEIDPQTPNLEKMVFGSSMIVFTGGEDIDPLIYGHEPYRGVVANVMRDNFEISLYQMAKKNRKPMFGICRGSQFLWAMGGGKLIQHMDKHGGIHRVLDLRSMKSYSVNSTHHQSAWIDSKPESVEILAVADPSISTMKMVYNPETENFDNFVGLEVEAWTNKVDRSLGIQWHPEMYGCPEAGVSLADNFVAKFMRG